MLRFAIIPVCIYGFVSCSHIYKSAVPDLKDVLHDRSSFISALDEESVDTTSSTLRWWESINDPLLNSYIENMLSDNLSLKEAEERIVQAREVVSMRNGARVPTLDIELEHSKSSTPANLSVSSSRTETERWNSGVQVSWQVDLFGRLRKDARASGYRLAAMHSDKEALEHLLIAEVLTRRVAIAINARLLKLSEENLSAKQSIYDLVKRRYDYGTGDGTLYNVYLAEENYLAVYGDIHNFRRQLTEEMYKLDVLLGKPPGSTERDIDNFPLLPPPSGALVCAPASLLDRRPDLQAAEFRITASQADVDVAIASLYPNLTLGASLGYSNDELSGLISGRQFASSLLSQITMPLFRGGVLRSEVRRKNAVVREMAAGYSAMVLNAMREVETALVAEQELSKELVHREKAVNALKHAEVLSETRYKEGLLSLRDVLENKRARYVSEQRWLQTQHARWLSRISLHLALGGRWLDKADDGLTNDNCGDLPSVIL